ncbi:MAG: helix-turn-helix domain-containing protein [Acutalibacteraceae bacterium]
MTQENMPDYETIRAAVAGEKWAVKKVIDCYADEIDQLATIEKKQPDGSIKKEIDEDMRQALVLKLIEAIPQFPLEKG